MYKNYSFYCCLVLLLGTGYGHSFGQGLQKSKKADKPNIVLIIVDQFRADASKREGFELDTTPFLDSLAKTGAWFNRAYTASPACIPSRTSMMTGRFPSATHVRSNMNLKDAYFKTDLYQVLKSAGYNTALIGKNHSYLQPDITGKNTHT
jgi:arylsulfatase A-like enzyme